jgi:hypothetical protein
MLAVARRDSKHIVPEELKMTEVSRIGANPSSSGGQSSSKRGSRKYGFHRSGLNHEY